MWGQDAWGGVWIRTSRVEPYTCTCSRRKTRIGNSRGAGIRHVGGETMTSLKKIAFAAALLAAAGAAPAQEPKPLEVIAFAGGGNWPIWAAQDRTFFANNTLPVNPPLP